MHHPNPEVYRRAAEILMAGEHIYACHAIHTAFYDVLRAAGFQDVWNFHEYTVYKDQFRRMFGPVRGQRAETHPFWNHLYSGPRREFRILALLLMADICENPV